MKLRKSPNRLVGTRSRPRMGIRDSVCCFKVWATGWTAWNG